MNSFDLTSYDFRAGNELVQSEILLGESVRFFRCQ